MVHVRVLAQVLYDGGGRVCACVTLEAPEISLFHQLAWQVILLVPSRKSSCNVREASVLRTCLVDRLPNLVLASASKAIKHHPLDFHAGNIKLVHAELMEGLQGLCSLAQCYACLSLCGTYISASSCFAALFTASKSSAGTQATALDPRSQENMPGQK